VFVTNAPWFVSNICWPVIKTFLPTVTGMKVSILNARQTSGAVLKAVRSELLPPFLGGSCGCKECMSGALRDGGSMAAWELQIGVPWRTSGSVDRPAAQTVATQRRWRFCCMDFGSTDRDGSPGARSRRLHVKVNGHQASGIVPHRDAVEGARPDRDGDECSAKAAGSSAFFYVIAAVTVLCVILLGLGSTAREV